MTEAHPAATGDTGAPAAADAPAGATRGTVVDELRAQQPWAGLIEAAREAMGHAYVPYSRYPVGAAALVDDGRTVTGANVENASYGLTLCAECGLVSALHAGGGGRLTRFVCVDGSGAVLMPCGRCRQLLFEHRAPGMQLLTVSGLRSMDEVLPDAFDLDGPA